MLLLWLLLRNEALLPIPFPSFSSSDLLVLQITLESQKQRTPRNKVPGQDWECPNNVLGIFSDLFPYSLLNVGTQRCLDPGLRV